MESNILLRLQDGEGGREVHYRLLAEAGSWVITHRRTEAYDSVLRNRYRSL